MRYFALIVFVIMAYPCVIYARPVSYPGGRTVMMQNNGDNHSLHTHYSPTAKYSIGLRNEYDRRGDFQNHSVQLNNLVKRWNNRDSQANFYLKSGAGYAIVKGNAEQSPSAFTGVAMDWEDRRYFVSYENRYVYADDITDDFHQSTRVGIAPYIGDFGDLHTWLMLQVDHHPKADNNDHYTVTPLIRLFYNTHLVETGLSDKNDIMFNYIKRF